MSLLDKLNTEQREAVTYTKGPLLLLAGAGSGKTRVLVYRTAYLVEQGISPYNILAITFTNKAAAEMRERINSIMPREDSVWVSTFHSMCVRILRRHIDNIFYSNQFTIYDSDDSEKLVKNALKELNLSDKQFSSRDCMSLISTWKDQLLTPDGVARKGFENFRQEQICKVYKLYQNKLKESNSLDFDDLIFKTVELFTTREDIARIYQERFQYIMVDEYQDTNIAQYTLVKILAEKHKNLCVVGDDDQSIYGWRGADINNILDFEKDYENAKVIRLEQNYRSTQTILNTANAVIKNNVIRKSKALWTKNNGGEQINFYKALTDLDEGGYVADKISEYVAGGANYRDFAIFYRNNYQSRAIEDQLVKKNIPYRIFGGIRFYERKEVKDIMAYLKLIYNPQDIMAMTRIINVPKRGIGKSTLDKVMNYSLENGISFFSAINRLDDIPSVGSKAKALAEFRDLINDFIEFSKEATALDLINKVLESTGYMMELKKEGIEEAAERSEFVMELVSKAAEFTESSGSGSLADFLEEVALVADIDSYEENDNTVALMTLHSSKGLEFPTVFIVGFEDGLFPSYRSITSATPKDLEEERRLLYVGITRAMERLYIVAATSRMQYGQTVYNSLSRFYEEIPTDLMKNQRIKKAEVLKNNTTENIQGRTGVSKFASIAKSKSSIDISFGAKNYSSYSNISTPKNVNIDFAVGDKVRQLRYGVGTVTDIRPAGADYEVTVCYEDGVVKKFMAHLSKLVKVQ